MSRIDTLEEGVRIALDSLRANKLRSGLTILGVAIGVGVVVTMAAFVTGIRATIMEGFEAAGPDNFFVTRFDFSNVRLVNEAGARPPWWNKPKITPREVERIAALPLVDEALFNFAFVSTISFEGREVTGIQSQGYSSGWPAYTVGEFVAGRDFTPEEVRQARPLVVLSAPLARELFGPLDPVGREVRATAGRRDVSERFRVVGVFETEENIFSAAVRYWALFPYTTAMKRLRADDEQGQIIVVPQDSADQAVAIDQVIATLRSMRGLGPREENDFAILRSGQLLETFNRFTGVFFLVMIALSSVGLLVGGIGVIGIMMISVTERTREIGIRKAVGATRQEILWQFLVEAAFLTLLGGAAGMILGAGIAEVVAAATPIPARIPLWSVAVAMAMAILTGMLFGLLPAYRGSRMEPVDALRYE